MVKILVEDGKVDPYAKDNHGLTPQHWVVSDGDIEKVKAFEEKFSGNAWALHAAAEYGYARYCPICSLEGTGLVRLSLTVTTILTATAPHHFTKQLEIGHVEMARLLVSEFGAKVNAVRQRLSMDTATPSSSRTDTLRWQDYLCRNSEQT